MQLKCLLCLNHFFISEKSVDSCHMFSSLKRFYLIEASDELECSISYARITIPSALRKPAYTICLAYCPLRPLDITVKL